MLMCVVMQDGEVRKAFQRSLTKQGFKFKLNTKVNGAKIESDKVTLDLETKKGEKETFEADVVLVSAGLSPPSISTTSFSVHLELIYRKPEIICFSCLHQLLDLGCM